MRINFESKNEMKIHRSDPQFSVFLENAKRQNAAFWIKVVAAAFLVSLFYLAASPRPAAVLGISSSSRATSAGTIEATTCHYYPIAVTDKGVKKMKIPAASPISPIRAWMKPEAARFGPAVPDIPAVLVDRFTLNGTVKMSQRFFDNAYLGGKAIVADWTVKMVDDLRKRVKARDTFTYDTTPLYLAFDANSSALVKGKRGLVIGSESPWLEAMLLEYGAAHITTLEFGEINSQHPQIDTMTPQDFTERFLTGGLPAFDFAVSYSSLEHDGMGRYGDVLNPEGDLQSMARIMYLVKPGGAVFIGVPCCHDKLEWNAHRIYGPKRLPMLMAGYHLVAVHPAKVELGNDENDATCIGCFQPMWVLQNRLGCEQYPKHGIFEKKPQILLPKKHGILRNYSRVK